MTRYPWDRWFSTGKFLLVRGQDYSGRTDSFVQQIRQRASDRGLRLRVWVAPDGSAVRVTVQPPKAKGDG